MRALWLSIRQTAAYCCFPCCGRSGDDHHYISAPAETACVCAHDGVAWVWGVCGVAWVWGGMWCCLGVVGHVVGSSRGNRSAESGQSDYLRLL